MGCAEHTQLHLYETKGYHREDTNIRDGLWTKQDYIVSCPLVLETVRLSNPSASFDLDIVNVSDAPLPLRRP